MSASLYSAARATGRFLAGRVRTACLVILFLAVIQAVASDFASACDGPCARAPIPPAGAMNS